MSEIDRESMMVPAGDQADPLRVLRQLIEAARQCVVRLVRTRLFLMFVALSVVGAIALFALPADELSRESGPEFTAMVLYLTVLQFGLPLAGVHLAATSIRDEIDRGTLSILQTRAISRTTLLFGRFLGTTVVVGLSAMAVMTLWFFALQSHGDAFRRGVGPDAALLVTFLKAVAYSVSSYTALGLFFGVWLSRPIVATVLFVAGLELFVSNLPLEAGLRSFSPTDAVRQVLRSGIVPESGSDLDRILNGLFRTWVARDHVEPWTVFLRVTALGLFLGAFTFSRREYAARARD